MTAIAAVKHTSKLVVVSMVFFFNFLICVCVVCIYIYLINKSECVSVCMYVCSRLTL
jgi:hypothetical protein